MSHRPRGTNSPAESESGGTSRRPPATSWQSTGLVVMARNADATRAPPQVVFCEVTSPHGEPRACSVGPVSRHLSRPALAVWGLDGDGAPGMADRLRR
jgi:hypothetical protein